METKRSGIPGKYSRARALFEQRQGGQRGTDGMSSSLWLEHRVQKEISCKENDKGKLRLNARGPY